MRDPWERRYNTLVDIIDETYGAAVTITMLEDLNERLSKNE